MHAAPALPDLQRQFLAALYDVDLPGPVAAIAGHGLEPDARLRIYRHSSEAIHAGALRTSYPAVLALVGEDFFDQTALGYRRAHPSRSGNLQTFGDSLADYLETLPEIDGLAYLPDIARLEWLRQECALAADADPLTPGAFAQSRTAARESARIDLLPSLRLLASRHQIFTIWRYALQPTSEGLTLDGAGENVMLWREDGEVAMAPLDGASFACIAALARGDTLDAAGAEARACEPGFDLEACLASLIRHGLITAITPIDDSREEPAPCR
jgi:hypothetical protein